jgi:hypothetical protein
MGFYTIKPCIVAWILAACVGIFMSPEISGYSVGEAIGYPVGIMIFALPIPGIFFFFDKRRDIFFLRFNILFIILLTIIYCKNIFM